jgi:hypothetical protein
LLANTPKHSRGLFEMIYTLSPPYIAIYGEREFILAGASAIQVSTTNFTNPSAPLEILEGIEEFMNKEGITDINELIEAGRG